MHRACQVRRGSRRQRSGPLTLTAVRRISRERRARSRAGRGVFRCASLLRVCPKPSNSLFLPFFRTGNVSIARIKAVHESIRASSGFMPIRFRRRRRVSGPARRRCLRRFFRFSASKASRRAMPRVVGGLMFAWFARPVVTSSISTTFGARRQGDSDRSAVASTAISSARAYFVVETNGIEPSTPCLQSRCSAN